MNERLHARADAKGDVVGAETMPKLASIVDAEASRTAGYGLVISPEVLTKEKKELARVVANAGGLGGIATGEWDTVRRKMLQEFSKAMENEADEYFEYIKRTKVTESNLAYSIHIEAVITALVRSVFDPK